MLVFVSSSAKTKKKAAPKKRATTAKDKKTPAKKTSSKKHITQLTTHYTESQLAKMKKPELIDICKSSHISGYSTKKVADLRQMILDRQNNATHTSIFVTMPLEKLKERAKREGVSSSGSRQNIIDRIHKKRGM